MTLPTQLNRDIGLYLLSCDASPFLKSGETSAFFQREGNLFCCMDILNKRVSEEQICTAVCFSILGLM